MSVSARYHGRPTVGFSKPYRDPAQVGRKNNPDWLVSEIGRTKKGAYAIQHRFFSEDRAREFYTPPEDERTDYDDRDNCDQERGT
jgi:hypothetical protein